MRPFTAEDMERLAEVGLALHPESTLRMAFLVVIVQQGHALELMVPPTSSDPTVRFLVGSNAPIKDWLRSRQAHCVKDLFGEGYALAVAWASSFARDLLDQLGGS